MNRRMSQQPTADSQQAPAARSPLYQSLFGARLPPRFAVTRFNDIAHKRMEASMGYAKQMQKYAHMGQLGLVQAAQRLDVARKMTADGVLSPVANARRTGTALTDWIDNVRPTFEGSVHAQPSRSSAIVGRFHPGNVLALRRAFVPGWYELAGPMAPGEENAPMFVEGQLRFESNGAVYLEQRARFLRPRISSLTAFDPSRTAQAARGSLVNAAQRLATVAAASRMPTDRIAAVDDFGRVWFVKY